MSVASKAKPIVPSEPVKSPPPAETLPTASHAAPATSSGRRILLIAGLALIGALGGWQARERLGARLHLTSGQADAAANGNGSRVGKATLGFAPADGSATGGNGAAASKGIESVPVEVVQRSSVLRLTGSLTADERSAVAANTSGIVAEVRVDRGSVVRKNDVLVQIDPTDAKNKLAEGKAVVEELRVRLGLDTAPEPFNPETQPEVKLAKATFELAQSNVKRVTDLYTKKVISADAFDQAKTEYELMSLRYRQALLQVRQSYQTYKTALARLAILEKALADTTIRAPFDGWVAEKLVAVGEQISSGAQSTKVVTLVRIDPLRLSLTVPQQSIRDIQPGQTVSFEVDSFPDRSFEGKVRFIAPVVTNETRSLIVEAVVPNPEGHLRPGLFATAQVELQKQHAELLVPQSAVQKVGEAARVFVVVDGAARAQIVALGEVRQNKVEIVSKELTGKERLVAQPELVRDGDAVR